MDNEELRKIRFKYILSYILPFTVYLVGLFGFMGFDVQVANEIGMASDLLLYIVLVIEMTVLISIFNFIAYLLNFKNSLKNENKNMLNKAIKFNVLIITLIIILIEVIRVM